MAEIDYFFEFSSQAAAFADSTVSPFLSDPTTSRTNIWSFDLGIGPLQTVTGIIPPSTEPTPYWCMVAQSASNAALLAHPNLRFFNLPGLALYQNTGAGFTAISVKTAKAQYASNWALGLASYSGPGDVLASSLFTAFWGFRAFSQAATGTRAVQLRRSSDSAVMDFATLPNGTLNAAAITAFAGGANLTVATMYDQTGNGNHMVPTNSTFEQAFTPNTLNGMGVFANPNRNATAYRVNTTFTILNTWSNCFYSVFKVTATSPGLFQSLCCSGQNELGLVADRDQPSNSISMKNEGGNPPDGDVFNNTVPEGVWHLAVGICNQNAGTTSFLNIDNLPLGPFASAPLDGDPFNGLAEVVMWGDDGFGAGSNSNPLQGYGAENAWFATPQPNAPWTLAQSTALIANAKAFWGI